MRTWTALVLLLAVSLAGCSGGGSGKDSDQDGIYDRQEKGGWKVVVDLMDRRIERRIYSDPNVHDTDGDGLSDLEEFRWFPPLDASSNDTDADGLSDCEEALHTVRAECEDTEYRGDLDGGYGTDPTKADSDPGYSRYVTEVLNFTDETGSLAGNPPQWGDGISDGDELAGFDVTLGSGAIVHVTTDPLNGDSDDDHLDDGEERFLYGSHPKNQDTDGDQCEDGRDPFPASDERYRLLLDTFTLLRDMDGPGGGADLRFELTVVENEQTAPASGSVPVSRDDETDVSNVSPGSVRAPCNYSPSDPWMLLQVQATDVDPGGPVALDITSVSDPDASEVFVPGVWWNVREDLYSWDGRTGATFVGPVIFEGADARLTLAGDVILS